MKLASQMPSSTSLIRKRINISSVLAGQKLGNVLVRPVTYVFGLDTEVRGGGCSRIPTHLHPKFPC